MTGRWRGGTASPTPRLRGGRAVIRRWWQDGAVVGAAHPLPIGTGIIGLARVTTSLVAEGEIAAGWCSCRPMLHPEASSLKEYSCSLRTRSRNYRPDKQTGHHHHSRQPCFELAETNHGFALRHCLSNYHPNSLVTMHSSLLWFWV